MIKIISLFLLGYLTCPPVIHEIGHVLGALITGGVGFPYWNYAETYGGNKTIITMGGPVFAILFWSGMSLWLFHRKPLLSAYCAGALHLNFKYTSFNTSDAMFLGIYEVVGIRVWATIVLVLYWAFWLMEFFAPNYSLPWDRKWERKEVAEYLSQIGLTKHKK